MAVLGAQDNVHPFDSSRDNCQYRMDTAVPLADLLGHHWACNKEPPLLLLLCRVPNEDRPKLDGGEERGREKLGNQELHWAGRNYERFHMAD